MRGRLFIFLAIACTYLMTYGSAWSAPGISVWVALSEAGGAHAEAAQALRATVDRLEPGRVEWREAHWQDFAKPLPRPDAIVAVGTVAQRGMQNLFGREVTAPPLLAILVPRIAFERIAEPDRLRGRSLSAVFLDQPPARQVDLIRLALPEARTIGILVGAQSRPAALAIEAVATSRNLRVVAPTVDDAGLFATLQSLLVEADMLLALPDPAIFNSQTAANILMATYRRKLPLLGFSPAYVKAGALLALYSTPIQIGALGGEMLSQGFSTGLPPARWPREFVVSVNPDVARSLGFVLDEAQLGERLRGKERP